MRSVLALALLALALPQEGARSALDRDPGDLPVCAADAWAEWTPRGAQPPGVRPFVERMTRAYRAGELPAALGEILDGLEAFADYPPLLHQGGVLYFRLRRYGDARELFERFLRVAPDLVAQTRALAHCHYSLGDYEEARAHYELILERAPDMVEAHRGLGLSLLRTGDPDGALRELRRVVELEPTHADAWTWIAQVHFDEDRGAEAREALDRAIELDPYEPRGWFLRAQIAWDAGEDEAGDAAHERYRLLDRAAQEARALEARLLLDPHQVGLLERLVECHRSVGNVAAVRNVGARLLAELPGDVDARIGLLDVLVDLEDREGAEVCALALEEVAGDTPRAWKRLEEFWDRAGDRRKRTEAAERYLRLRYREPERD